MADIFNAELSPGKLEVVSQWLKEQEWAAGIDFEAAPLESVSSYRFDDPAGVVGIEIHIVATGDRVFQIPLTYRGAPLDGAENFFVAEISHSVLGPRWVYAGIGDPVFIDQLVATIKDFGTSATQYLVDDAGNRQNEITELTYASGTGPVEGATSFDVVNELDLGADVAPNRPGLLLGTWTGQATPVILARLV